MNPSNLSASPRFGFNPIWKFGKAVLSSAAVSIATGYVIKHGKPYIDKLTDKLGEGAKELKNNWEKVKAEEAEQTKKETTVSFEVEDEPEKK